MEPGFPKRGLITDRGFSADIGGDYRYKYDLCPRARTVVVTDTALDIGTFTPLSVASSARVATINLTAGFFYHSIIYRSAAKQVYVFGTQNVHVIDANPDSGTFNTIVNTINTTLWNINNLSTTYNATLDIFVSQVGKFNPDLSVSNYIINSNSVNGYYTSTACYYPTLCASGVGSVNGEVFAVVRNTDEVMLVYFGTNTNINPFRINKKWYVGTGTQLFRLNDAGVREAVISMTTTSRGDAAFAANSKHLLITNYNNTMIPLVSISPTFASVGNVYTLITSILATNHFTVINASYSPYSGKIYLRPANGTTVNTAGLDRYYIIDTTQAFANMAVGYRTIDEGGITMSSQYMNGLTCFNGLRINEYEF